MNSPRRINFDRKRGEQNFVVFMSSSPPVSVSVFLAIPWPRASMALHIDLSGTADGKFFDVSAGGEMVRVAGT